MDTLKAFAVAALIVALGAGAWAGVSSIFDGSPRLVEAAVRGAIFIGMVLVAWGAFALVRGLYRRARGVSVETVGSAVGTLTRARRDAQDRFDKAFKTSRDA